MPALPITAVCDRTFHASRSSGARDPKDVRWIVWHDEEAPTAASAAKWFADPRPPDEGGPAGSAHLCVDDEVCYRTLPNDVVPWAASSCFGVNHHGFHIETAGFARWPKPTWLTHRDALRRLAYKTALHCVEFNIAPVFVFAGQLPNVDGITTHAEVTKASKRLDPQHAWKYTHSDPGLFFPRRWVMARVREYIAHLGV